MLQTYFEEKLHANHLPSEELTFSLNDGQSDNVLFLGEIDEDYCLYHCNETMKQYGYKVMDRYGASMALDKGCLLEISNYYGRNTQLVLINNDYAEELSDYEFECMEKLRNCVQRLVDDVFNVLVQDGRDILTNDRLRDEAISMYF